VEASGRSEYATGAGGDAPEDDVIQRAVPGYAHEHRPLAGYSALSAIFAVAFAGGLRTAYRRRGGLPARYRVSDVVMAGIATHKLTRRITKDKVTGVIRAPFVRFVEPAGHGEVCEVPRGEGLRLAIGELLVCPYCLGQWVTAGFGIGMVGAPEATRLVSFMYTAEAISDFLQLAYRSAEDGSDRLAGTNPSRAAEGNG
jgi:hypothetical protein